MPPAVPARDFSVWDRLMRFTSKSANATGEHGVVSITHGRGILAVRQLLTFAQPLPYHFHNGVGVLESPGMRIASAIVQLCQVEQLDMGLVDLL